MDSGGSMKESDILLSRAEKLRRDARSVRHEANRLSLASDQQCLLDMANNLETHARDLEVRARHRAHNDERKPGGTRVEPARRSHEAATQPLATRGHREGHARTG
jgi:hypothetical protein